MTRVNSNFRSRLRQGFLGKASNVTKHSGRTSGISVMFARGASTAEVGLLTKHRTLESVEDLQIIVPVAR